MRAGTSPAPRSRSRAASSPADGESLDGGGDRRARADPVGVRIWGGEFGAAAAQQRPGTTGLADAGAAAAVRIDQDAVRCPVQRRAQQRGDAEGVARLLVLEGELEDDAPAVLVVVPEARATGHRR